MSWANCGEIVHGWPHGAYPFDTSHFLEALFDLLIDYLLYHTEPSYLIWAASNNKIW